MRPKYHYALHLPDMLKWFGTLISTLVNERRHRVVKRYTRDRCCPTRWELGALEEVCTFQMHEASIDWAHRGLVNPHPARGNHLRALQQMWPHIQEEIVVANAVRNTYGTATCGDVVFYDHGHATGRLELCVQADSVELALLTPMVAINAHNVWPSFRFSDECIVIQLDRVMCSTIYTASNGHATVYKPFFAMIYRKTEGYTEQQRTAQPLWDQL